MATFEEVEKMFRNTPAMTSLFGLAVLEFLEEIKSIIGTYPVQPARDKGKSFNTYVRGVGSYPKSAFVPANVPGGFKIVGAGKLKKAGRVRFTSQKMNTKFRTHVETGGDTITGTLNNDATYSGYVIGSEQTSYHKENGWENPEDSVEKAFDELDKVMDAAVDKFLESLV